MLQWQHMNGTNGTGIGPKQGRSPTKPRNRAVEPSVEQGLAGAVMERLVAPLVAEVSAARQRIEELARENGHLQADLDMLRAQVAQQHQNAQAEQEQAEVWAQILQADAVAQPPTQLHIVASAEPVPPPPAAPPARPRPLSLLGRIAAWVVEQRPG